MRTSPPTVSPDTRVGEVAKRLLSEGVSGIPVVDANGTVLGMVTEEDLVRKHARVHVPTYFGFLGAVIPFSTHRTEEDLRKALAVTAREVMSSDLPTVSSQSDVDDVASIMVDEEVEPVMVVDDGALVGMVQHSDIIRLLIVEETDEGPRPGG